MKEFVYIFAPLYGDDFAELNRLSSWLEKQAQKGHFITSFGWLWKFRKSEPATVKYMFLKNHYWMPKQEDCEELGWKLIESASNNHTKLYIAESTDVQKPQINQTAMRRELNNNLRERCFATLLFMVLLVLNCIYIEETPMLEFVLICSVFGSISLLGFYQVISLVSFIKQKIFYECLTLRLALGGLLSLPVMAIIFILVAKEWLGSLLW